MVSLAIICGGFFSRINIEADFQEKKRSVMISMTHSASSRITVSVLIGLVCVLVGVFEIANTGVPLISVVGWITIVVGVVIAIIGIIVGLNSPPQLDLIEAEKVEFEDHPSVKPAFLRIAIGVLLSIPGVYLMVALDGIWYVVSLMALIVGVVLCIVGIHRYWMTHCTTYYVTNNRFVTQYRFLGGYTSIIGIADVVSAEPRFNLIQRIVGTGDFIVTSGSGRGGGQRIEFRDIDDLKGVTDIAVSLGIHL